MKVGLTYDLRDEHRAEGLSEDQVAEFDRADTIDALEAELERLGHRVERIGHAKKLIARLAAGGRWDLVFNIAEGHQGLGREALVPALLEAYGIPVVFSDPLVCAVTLHKALTKRVLRDCGLPTADFALIEHPRQLAGLELPFPLFAKPVAEGSSKGVGPASKAGDPQALERVVTDLLERYRQPVLVETFLPGREFTVGLLGTGRRARAVGALEVRLRPSAEAEIYTYANKEDCEEHVEYTLARDALAGQACALALAAWRALYGRDGGRVDLRADGAGRLHVIEVNVLPGMHPEHSDLPILCGLAGVSYSALVAEILGSALERVAAPRHAIAPCTS